MSLKKNIFEVVQTQTSINFFFSSTLENIDIVCDKTADYLGSKIQGIETHMFSIILGIREALTNAVRHGNQNDPGKMVRISLTITENESIKFMIEDQGDGFDWKKQDNADLPENNDHGRGILIMKSYFTHHSYNDKGNILYLEKNFF